jgi:hypothetical protein
MEEDQNFDIDKMLVTSTLTLEAGSFESAAPRTRGITNHAAAVYELPSIGHNSFQFIRFTNYYLFN